jgi:cytosine/adenosine deaminase-related metal-dependent hydrolase
MTLPISRKSFFKLGAGLAALTAANLAAADLGAAASAAPAKAEPAPLKPVKTLIQGADVMTCEAGKPDLLGYDVLIDGGKIVAVEKSIPPAGATVVEGKGMVLMPGFTDGFRHNWETFANGRILKTNNSYPRYYDTWFPLAPGHMTPEDLYLSEYLGGLEAINSGYTNVINYAHAHYTPQRLEAGIEGYKASGAGGSFCFTLENERPPGYAPKTLLDVVKQWSAPVQESVYKTAEAMRDKHFSGGRDADLVFGFSNTPSPGKPRQQVIDHFKRMRQMQPQVIIEHYSALLNDPAHPPPPGILRTAADIHEAGVFGPDYILSHALTLTDAELQLMAAGGVSTCSAPLVEMSYDRVETCIHGRAHKYGVPAAFGFDAPMEAVRDPFEMMRMGFAVLFKTQGSWAVSETLNSDDIVAFKTRVGAVAAKKGDVAGTITPGKRADLVLVKIDPYRVPHNGSLADKVVNFCALADIDSVWVGGKLRKSGGQMIGVDWAKLAAERAAVDERIWAAMGSPKWGVQHS